MNYRVTIEVLNVQYQREYASDAGPKEILERIRDAVEAEPADRARADDRLPAAH